MIEWAWLLITALLGALNLFQLVYWSRQVHKLIDKLMSRNYADYVTVQRPAMPDLPQASIFNEQTIDQDKDLAALNNIMVGL